MTSTEAPILSQLAQLDRAISAKGEKAQHEAVGSFMLQMLLAVYASARKHIHVAIPTSFLSLLTAILPSLPQESVLAFRDIYYDTKELYYAANNIWVRDRLKAGATSYERAQNYILSSNPLHFHQKPVSSDPTAQEKLIETARFDCVRIHFGQMEVLTMKAMVYFDVTYIKDRVYLLLSVRAQDTPTAAVFPPTEGPLLCHSKIVAALKLTNPEIYDKIKGLTDLHDGPLFTAPEEDIPDEILERFEEICQTANALRFAKHPGPSHSPTTSSASQQKEIWGKLEPVTLPTEHNAAEEEEWEKRITSWLPRFQPQQ